MKKILVTGSCGFIFSNFMRQVMGEKLPYQFVSIDKVVEPYNRHNVEANRDHNFYMGDIADETFVDNVFALERPDIVVHGAAFSFVDASINSAKDFIRSNVVGTQFMVDAAVKYGVERFVLVSTDEVYGQLSPKEPAWNETSPINPRNPYSASKAASELMVRAASETHKLPFNITRCCNNFGGSQPPRNLVPKIIHSVLHGRPVPLHGNGKQMREWIYVQDHCDAILTVINNAPVNQAYNIGSGVEMTNLAMIETVSKMMGKSPNYISVSDRKGHDFRYRVDCSKIKQLGWAPSFNFEDGMKYTIDWYLRNDWYFRNFS